MSKIEELKIRPYARLLTMLGDQLIKDETIALIELVKNSYDADATHVKISFCDFNDDFTANRDSTIIIEDDGNGMDDIILKEAWMNPATPEKLKRKRIKNTTDKGRIMQGEKGIGRFAIFKLGRKIDVITRRQKTSGGHFIDEPESNHEFVLKYDFSDYDLDFLTEESEEKEIFLDDLSVTFEERTPREIIDRNAQDHIWQEERKPYGTRIVISKLNGTWNKRKIEKVYQSILRMQPIFGDQFVQDFLVSIDLNGSPFISSEKGIEDIQHILENKAVFIIDGSFDANNCVIKYSVEDITSKETYSFKLTDPEMQGVGPMRVFFESLENRKIECGSFSYRFYVFDMDISVNSPDTRYYLDPDEKRSIKAHRVYLYRDGIRVMPYGDPEDDWLNLDVIRGVERSGSIFGNDQLVGYIKISQIANPNLRDKTNREGLIEDGYAKSDLISICQLILRYIMSKNYHRYKIDKKRKKEKQEEAINKPSSLITKAREEKIGEKAVKKALSSAGMTKVSDLPETAIDEGQQVLDRFLDDLEQAYKKEVDVLENRISTTENLAAIGLSAETAYHDARIILQEANNALGNTIKSYNMQEGQFLERDRVVKELKPIHRQTKNAASLMLNVQKLFPSTKNKKGQISIQNVASVVKDLYSTSMKRYGISCEIRKSSEDLLVECTDAVLLQVFINLFDNSLYWLKTAGMNREIIVEIHNEERTVIFADSGPGVRNDDAPYIFEAFYSGKGEEGKGLGLYIARQLLERYESRIELINDERKKLLKGANFEIRFGNEVS